MRGPPLSTDLDVGSYTHHPDPILVEALPHRRELRAMLEVARPVERTVMALQLLVFLDKLPELLFNRRTLRRERVGGGSHNLRPYGRTDLGFGSEHDRSTRSPRFVLFPLLGHLPRGAGGRQ